jgi:hypothetical protein
MSVKDGEDISMDDVAVPGEYFLELLLGDVSQATSLTDEYIDWDTAVEGQRNAVETVGPGPLEADHSGLHRKEEKYDSATSSQIKYDDVLLKVVADQGRHAYQRIGRALGFSPREIDDIPRSWPYCTNEEKLQRLLYKWLDIKGSQATRSQLLQACKEADVYGAVELALSGH